jgi:hypothetical protein
MEDDPVRIRLQAGDFTSLGDETMTGEERDLVVAAADEDREVDELVAFDELRRPAAGAALSYISKNEAGLSPAVHSLFSSFLGTKFGGGVAQSERAGVPDPPQGS